MENNIGAIVLILVIGQFFQLRFLRENEAGQIANYKAT